MDRAEFQKLYHDYERGRIDRRTFLKASGLGMAAAILAACTPGGGSTSAPSTAATAAPPTTGPTAGPTTVATQAPIADWVPPTGVDLGKELHLTTWPSYHNQEVLDKFTSLTGVAIIREEYGSNEEMLAKLQVGSTGWDVLVPTNYTFETYGQLGLLEVLDLSKIPNFDAARYEARFLEPAHYPAGSQNLLGFSKDWGTTGYVVNTKQVTTPMTTWKDYFDRTQTDLSGKVTIHDYQLTAIGNALKYHGYSFNSVDPNELAKAEELLLATATHFQGITSVYQPPMRSGDAWVAMAWTGDAVQLNRDIPEIKYVIGTEGGEIWSDFYAVIKTAPNKAAAYAFLDYMANPKVMAKDAEFHGYPIVDSAGIELLPASFTSNPIIYPDAKLLTPLEFGAAVTLTNKDRADIWNRVKIKAAGG
jgi:spermidine/putrescine transport system substrate-binding protein